MNAQTALIITLERNTTENTSLYIEIVAFWDIHYVVWYMINTVSDEHTTAMLFTCVINQ